jgi:hypothetical protein
VSRYERNVNKNDVLAVLQVGVMKRLVLEEVARHLAVFHDPVENENEAHCLVEGLNEHDSIIADLIAMAVD